MPFRAAHETGKPCSKPQKSALVAERAKTGQWNSCTDWSTFTDKSAIIPAFEKTIEDAITGALANCPPGTIVLAAVSGGADSTAMLAALAAIRDRAAAENHAFFSLHCIHIEHGIRPAAESQGDADFVRALCEQLQIPCRIVAIPPGIIAAAAKKRGIGIEAAARLYRHRAWFREARHLETANEPAMVRILTAHTADDMLETALMRILRGAGPAGLAAMPAVNGPMLRPLLTLSRSDVLRYLGEKGISWREDSTNADIHFFRNRVRNRLIPLLAELFPQWRTAIASLAETQSLAADFIRSEASRRIEWLPDAGASALSTAAGNFFAQPVIIREEALFQGINTLMQSGHTSAAKTRSIKRANIRRFCEGKITAINLCSLQLRKNARQVTIRRVAPFEDHS